jgi:hypothetical protein
LGEIIDCLPKKKKNEIYMALVDMSIPKDSPLIKEIITKKPSRKLEEILKEEGIELIE